MITLKLNKETESLRTDFRKWLKSNNPPQLSANHTLDEFVEVSRNWQAQLAKERFVAVHWPEEYGGRGLSITEETIIQESLAAAGSPQLVNLFGLTMVGPVLIEHGTDDQRKRYLSKILSADEIWCQGFSEPEAGSDLAALKTIGVPVKNEKEEVKSWSITGQKIWTSFAQYADWCFMLARTDTSVPKHKGLSYFLLPMKSKGIEVRPLTQISGDQEFNELFLDTVEIPSNLMVGNPGDGWKMAISTLMYERVILTFARHLQSKQALDDIARTVSDNNLEHKKSFGQLLAKNAAVRALAFSHLVKYDKDNSPGPEGSLDKLTWSEAFQQIAKFALNLQAKEQLYSTGVNQHRYLYSRGRTIAAGTSEIQRSIIAERLLKLPRAR